MGFRDFLKHTFQRQLDLFTPTLKTQPSPYTFEDPIWNEMCYLYHVHRVQTKEKSSTTPAGKIGKHLECQSNQMFFNYSTFAPPRTEKEPNTNDIQQLIPPKQQLMQRIKDKYKTFASNKQQILTDINSAFKNATDGKTQMSSLKNIAILPNNHKHTYVAIGLPVRNNRTNSNKLAIATCQLNKNLPDITAEEHLLYDQLSDTLEWEWFAYRPDILETRMKITEDLQDCNWKVITDSKKASAKDNVKQANTSTLYPRPFIRSYRFKLQ